MQIKLAMSVSQYTDTEPSFLLELTSDLWRLAGVAMNKKTRELQGPREGWWSEGLGGGGGGGGERRK